MLGDLDRRCAGAGLAARRLEVQRQSHRLGHRVEHGLPVQVVPEDVVDGTLAEDAGHAGGIERLEQLARSQTDEIGDGGWIDRRPEDGGGLDDTQRLSVELGDSHDDARRRAQLGNRPADVEKPLASSRSSATPSASSRPSTSSGLPPAVSSTACRPGPGRHRVLLHDDLGDRIGVERRQRQLLDTRRVDRAPLRVAARHRGARRTEHHERKVADPLGEQSDELHRRRVGPMEILDDEERRAGGGECLDAFEQLLADEEPVRRDRTDFERRAAGRCRTDERRSATPSASRTGPYGRSISRCSQRPTTARIPSSRALRRRRRATPTCRHPPRR